MEKITSEQIKHLAELSALAITETGAQKMKTDLEQILEFVDKINSVGEISDLTFTNTLSLDDLRQDIPSSSLSQAEVLSNAPNAEAGAFVVSKVVD